MSNEIPSSPKTNFIKRFWHEHSLFYLIAILLTLATSAVYLLAQHSGGKWAWDGLPLDDNWIHLVYAKSLVQEGWFNYNPGIPEAGMSSPLWVILLAMVYKVFTPFGVSPQWCAKGLSLLFAFSVPLATYHLARAFRLSTKWACFIGLLTIIEPNLAYGNLAGMEVPLFTFLTLLALWLSQRKHYLLTGIVLGLGVLTRGEAVVNALIIGIAILIPTYLKRRELSVITTEELRIGFQLFLPSLILGSMWSLYNYSINGHLLPNSYYVKHNFALGYFNLENLINLIQGYIRHLTLFDGFAGLISLLLFLTALWSLYQSKQLLVAIPLVLIPFVQMYAFSINIKVVAVETPWTYFTRRYLDFLLPLWIIQVGIGAAYLWGRVSDQRNRWLALTAPLLLFGMIAVFGWNTVHLHQHLIEQYSWNTENVEQVNVAMGKWLGENLPSDVTIGVTDAGAMRYWSRPDQTVIDFLGLNCTSCIGRPMEELIAEFQPDYIVVFRPALTGNIQYEELYSIQAQHNTILGGNELVVAKLNP